MTKDWRRQGCGLKGGCPPCLAPGVGGTLSIKVSQVPIGIAAFDWQIWVDVCFVSSTNKSGDFLFETIGYIKGTYLYIDKLVCRPGKLLMQRHDDEVRNNVIHPSVILSLPLPSSGHASDRYWRQPKNMARERKEKKKKKKKEQGNGEQDGQRAEGNRRPHFLSRRETDERQQLTRTQGPTQPPLPPPPPPALDYACTCSYREPSLFPKAISCRPPQSHGTPGPPDAVCNLSSDTLLWAPCHRSA